MSETRYDTHATTTYLVRLTNDARVFANEDGTKDVYLRFPDNSRAKGTETLWIDAKVAKFQAERSAGYLKGDEVQITGKTRYRRNKKSGELEGIIYDAMVQSFVKLSDRVVEAPPAGETPDMTGTPAFE
jgi:hypothetical protein